MNTKHTPAPWKITKEIGDIPMKSIIRTIDGRLISKTYGTNVEEIEATTKLQAAAPELLEALQDIVEYHSNIETEFKGHKLGGTIPFLKAKAAIKKATE